MITANNLIETLITLRFYIKNNCVYERLPEEGPSVIKRVEIFDTEEEAIAFLVDHKKRLLRFLKAAIVVNANPGVDMNPPAIVVKRKPSMEKPNAGNGDRP